MEEHKLGKYVTRFWGLLNRLLAKWEKEFPIVDVVPVVAGPPAALTLSDADVEGILAGL